MADNFDFLETFAISTSEAQQPQNVYEKFILDVANKVTSDLREYIKTNANNSGGLASSVVFVPNGALTFEIQADDYFKFQDEGVNAVGTKNHGSSYSFKYPEVSPRMAKAIQQWKGFDMSHAYAVASSIKQHGIAPKNIIENVLSEKTLDAIARDLAEVTGLMFTINFEKDTKQWQ